MSSVAFVVAASVPVAVGLLVLRHGRQPVIGSLLIAQGVSFGVLLGFPAEGSSRSGLIADQLTAGAWVFLFLWLVLIAYLVPDGHFASPRWRAWVRIGLIGVVGFLIGSAGDVASFKDAHGGTAPPLPWLPAPVSGVVGAAGLLLTVLLLFGSVLAVRARLRQSSGDARLQLLWLVWGATSLPVALSLAWLGHFAFDDNALVTGFALILAGVALPLAVGIAILRYRLFDIQVVLSRTLTYGALVVGVVAVYAAVLLLAQRFSGDRATGGLVAVGVVAVAVHPAYAWVRTRTEHWVYGDRSDPVAALRRLGASVEAADPLALVESISHAVAEAIKVDHVWIESPVEAAPGEVDVVRVPLVHRGEHIGNLVVDLPPGRTLSGRDTTLLNDLARQAALTVRAGQLAAELQAARLRLVTARAEERKRLRRDLHDGLGPTLAAVVLKLNAAQAQQSDSQRNALLTETREETRAAIAEVRRLVDNLRPPAVDEVGLAQALRQRAASLSSTSLVYEVQGPETLAALPAAVEVAAYRIVSEAMTNVAKHSGASRCVVQLTLGECLALAVSDNGNGVPGPVGNGVGHTSMAERAAELGGSCSVTARPGGGLVIIAELPVVAAPGREGTS